MVDKGELDVDEDIENFRKVLNNYLECDDEYRVREYSGVYLACRRAYLAFS
jgi:hypothetical protein